MSRLVVVPLVLLLGVAGATFAFAKWHPAKLEVSSGSVRLGDPYRGATTFSTTCASCHGQNGSGGTGPRLKGLAVTIARVKQQIDAGGGAMPAGLVKGGAEEDVLAYVATLVKAPSG